MNSIFFLILFYCVNVIWIAFIDFNIAKCHYCVFVVFVCHNTYLGFVFNGYLNLFFVKLIGFHFLFFHFIMLVEWHVDSTYISNKSDFLHNVLVEFFYFNTCLDYVCNGYLSETFLKLLFYWWYMPTGWHPWMPLCPNTLLKSQWWYFV